MEQLVGREAERRQLELAIGSKDPEFIAIYGRRRVGKTFLVRRLFAAELCFELTGIHNAPLPVQLRNFQRALATAVGGPLEPAVPSDWLHAFAQLERYLAGLSPRAPQVVFLDELPWLAARRSGFLSALEHFWNAWASRHPWLKLVVCGSAASWMRRNLLRAKGGLHNRVTRRLRLEPFDLATAEQLLHARNVRLDRYQVLELYMAMGGVPHYLKEVQRGESAQQSIARIAFARDGLLHDEFTNLYASLFEKAQRHEKVVRALARHPLGMVRNDLIAVAGLSSGGTTSAVLDDLEQSGFIAVMPPYHRHKRESVYRLVDEYSLFYLRWIEPGGKRVSGGWAGRRETGHWRAWSGLAFEAICLKHVAFLKRALGIAAVATEEWTWSERDAADGGPGAQIDLVIDRADGCTHLCEMKFSRAPFAIDKRYAAELAHKRAAFQRATGGARTTFTTMVTTFGLKDNRYASDVDNSLTMDALFGA